MGNTNQNGMAQDASNDCMPSKSEMPRRNQASRQSEMNSKKHDEVKKRLFVGAAAGFNQEVIEAEMEGLYREENNLFTMKAA